ncbi:MAG TPA: metalloregulator ArsR/SmtB family transcription factor [Planctomycetota bacterium]|nr:metalloregulator ArsR/SmtB family transcription factor [Planctomycetota bacterium]
MTTSAAHTTSSPPGKARAAGAGGRDGAGGAGLAATTELLRLLSDPSRVRLLHLLAGQELTVAELTGASRLAQSRVSSHLQKLRGAGFLRVRRSGTSTFYALHEAGLPADAARLWTMLREHGDDALLEADRRRLRELLRARRGSWADTVAGSMERHYSPGRTWEAAARSLIGLARLGRVLDVASGDGALAELVAPRAASVCCLDSSERVVEAGRERRGARGRVRFLLGDMHALPFPDASFDQVLLLNALSYAHDPPQVVREAVRACRPGGDLVALALKAHRHAEAAAAFGHVQHGFQPARLAGLFQRAGCEVSLCEVTSRERQQPHFEVITVYARRREKPR